MIPASILQINYSGTQARLARSLQIAASVKKKADKKELQNVFYRMANQRGICS